MAVTPILVGSASAAATTIAIPAHQAGDLIVIYASRANATAPTLPSGWTTPTGGSAGASGISTRVGYKVATSTTDTSGTWTNAQLLFCEVWRFASGVGALAFNTATSASVNYAALTPQVQDGSSIVTGHAVALTAVTGLATPPTGMTNRQSLANGTTIAGALADTNGGVTSWSSASVTISASKAWRSIVVEILGPTTINLFSGQTPFLNPGFYALVCPVPGTLDLEAFGSAGAGYGSAGGFSAVYAAGGAAYAGNFGTFTVTAGQVFYGYVAAGGVYKASTEVDGAASWISADGSIPAATSDGVLAAGSLGAKSSANGAPGLGANSIGTVTYDGGAGLNTGSFGSYNAYGGGGAGSAGPGGAATSSGGGAGGTPDGGAGGKTANGAQPGGGGPAGKSGGDGEIRTNYTPAAGYVLVEPQISEAQDTASFTVQESTTAHIAATEAKDTAAIHGYVPTSLSLATSEASDVASFAAVEDDEAVLTSSELADTAAFSVTGTGGSDAGSTTANLATTESLDTAAFAAKVKAHLTLAATEDPDVAAFDVKVRWHLTLAATEAIDTASVLLGDVQPTTVSLAASEAHDTAAFVSQVKDDPTLAATEGRDIASVLVSTYTPAVTGGSSSGPTWKISNLPLTSILGYWDPSGQNGAVTVSGGYVTDIVGVPSGASTADQSNNQAWGAGPTAETSGINGLQTLLYQNDGRYEALSVNATIAQGAQRGATIVFRTSDPNNNGNYGGGLIGWDNGGSYTNGCALNIVNGILGFGQTGSGPVVTCPTNVCDGKTHIASIVTDATGGSCYLYVDGALVGTGSMYNWANGGNGILIGRTTGQTGQNFFGEIGGVVLYPNKPYAYVREEVEALLAKQWGATLSSSNPFASLTPPGIFSTASNSSDATTVVVSQPTGGWQNGNVLIAYGSYLPGGTSTLTLPTGWHLIKANNIVTSTINNMCWTAYHVCGASEPSSYTFTLSGGHPFFANIIEFGGVDTSTPIGAVSTNATAGASTTVPAITAAASSQVLAIGITVQGTSTVPTANEPTGFSEAFTSNAQDTLDGFCWSTEVAALFNTTAVPATTLSFNESAGTFTSVVGFLIELQMAGTGASTPAVVSVAVRANETKDAAAVTASLTAGNVVNASLVTNETKDAASVAIALSDQLHLAATESKDVAQVTTTASNRISLAVAENRDTASINAGTTASVSLAVTEAKDTAAVSVSTSDLASFAASEQKDAAAISAKVISFASLVVSEAKDVVAVDLTQANHAQLAASEAKDSAALTVKVITTASMAASEARDVASVTIALSDLAQLAATEAKDRAAINAGQTALANLAATEAKDSAALIASTSDRLALAVTENRDTAAIHVIESTDTSLAVSEAKDVAGFVVTQSTSVQLAASERPDTAAAHIGLAVSSSLAVTEAKDRAFISTGTGAFLALDAAERADTAAVSVGLATGIALHASEAADGAHVALAGIDLAALSVTEAKDRAAIAAVAFLPAHLAATEAKDAAHAALALAVHGPLTASEQKDSSAFAIALSNRLSFAASDHPDSASASMKLSTAGPLVASEAPDAAQFNMQSVGSLVLDASEAIDVAHVTSSVSTHASLAVSERRDTATFQAKGVALASLVASEARDSISIHTVLSDRLSFAAQEAHDGVAIHATVQDRISFAVSEAKDSAAITGGLSVIGSLVASERKDTASIQTIAGPRLTLGAVEKPDTSAFTASATNPLSFAVREHQDGVSFGLALSTGLAVQANELADVTSFNIQVIFNAQLAASEAIDHASVIAHLFATELPGMAYSTDEALFSAVATHAPVWIPRSSDIQMWNSYASDTK